MRILRETIYDYKEMGFNAVILFIGPLVYLAAFVIAVVSFKSGISDAMLNIFEIVMPLIGGYGAVMLMQELLDTEGGEILFTYHHTSLYWGVIRQFRFYVIYQAINALVIVAMSAIDELDFGKVFLLNTAQCFAVMGMAFLGVAVTKKVAIGTVVVIAFTGIQITLGQEFPVFNLIYIFCGSAGSQLSLSNAVFNSIILGLFGYGFGQTWIKPK